jgi:hypothetical protein
MGIEDEVALEVFITYILPLLFVAFLGYVVFGRRR